MGDRVVSASGMGNERVPEAEVDSTLANRSWISLQYDSSSSNCSSVSDGDRGSSSASSSEDDDFLLFFVGAGVGLSSELEDFRRSFRPW